MIFDYSKYRYSETDEISKPLVLLTRYLLCFFAILESIICLFCLFAPAYIVKFIYSMTIFDIALGKSRMKDILYFEKIEPDLGYRFKLAFESSCIALILLVLAFIFCSLHTRKSVNGPYFKPYYDNTVVKKMIFCVFIVLFIIYYLTYHDIDYGDFPNYFFKKIMSSEISVLFVGFYFTFTYFITITTLNAIMTLIFRREHVDYEIK